MRYARRTDRINISGIRRVFEAASEDAINLGLGEPDFDTPDYIKDAATEAIQEGRASSYTTNRGIKELREAIADYVDYEASPKEILITAGGSEALHLAVQSHVNPGEEVIIPDPGFVSYDALTKVADAEPVPVALDDELHMRPERVKEAITDDTSAIILNSPANPTGAVQTKDEMKSLAEIADDYDVPLISDEVYDHLIYEGEHHSARSFGDNVIVVNSASKAFAMTGWRLGYAVADEETCNSMIKVHQYIQACATSASQHAALEAFSSPKTPDTVEEMRRAFEERRDLVLEKFDEMGLDYTTPRGAFYAYPEVPEGFVDACIERDVIVVPGDAFGENGEGHARLSYATSKENLEEALERIEEVVENL